MSYQVTITRGDENSDDGMISREEWLSLTGSDTSLKIIDADEQFPEVQWTNGNDRMFYWEDIGIWANSPDEEVIVKMIEIAGKLKANVIGEDGTVFSVSVDGQLIEKSS